MINEYFEKLKRGDIVHFKSIFGLSGIGIFDKITSDGLMHLYCLTYKDLKNTVFL